jgi:hypothetical protein
MLNSTVRYLTGAGWAPGRRIDTAPYVAALAAAGYPTFPVQVEFIAEFGGIVITRPKPLVVRFDILELLGTVVWPYEDEGLDNYAEYLGVRWSLVGLVRLRESKPHMQDWDFTLMITDAGVIHGVGDGFDMVAGRVGDDTLMDNLCDGIWEAPPSAEQNWLFEPAPGYPRNAGKDEA